MPSTLQALRRKAGYASAREFAEHIGVPFPTYSRYESSPEKIPSSAAWMLADTLGCSIDAVVGRASIDDVEMLRGEVQREYDALDPELRDMADAYRAYLRWLARNKQAAARRNAERAYEKLAAHYEAAWRRDLMDRAAEAGEFYRPMVDGEEARDAFKAYVEALAQRKRGHQKGEAGKADAKRAERDAATVRKIMDAYDRIHDWADRLPDGV